MSSSARLDGSAALRATLAALPSAVGWQHQRDALKAAAEPIRAAAAVTCPRGAFDEQWPEHMADNIVIHALSERDVDKDVELTGDEAAVEIGPARKFFYGRFLEYGTRYMDAQPFMRPAFDQHIDDALKLAADKLWQYVQAEIGGKP